MTLTRMPRLTPWLLLALSAIGCQGGDRAATGGDGPFVPPPEVARAALVEALDGWRADQPVARDPKLGPPRVGLVDNDRIDQHRLLNYDVLGPIDLGVGRGFTVRLRLEGTGPEATTEPVVRYVVFGQGPVWVFRLEDYERISHWEHKMDPDEQTDPVPPGD